MQIRGHQEKCFCASHVEKSLSLTFLSLRTFLDQLFKRNFCPFWSQQTFLSTTIAFFAHFLRLSNRLVVTPAFFVPALKYATNLVMIYSFVEINSGAVTTSQGNAILPN